MGKDECLPLAALRAVLQPCQHPFLPCVQQVTASSWLLQGHCLLGLVLNCRNGPGREETFWKLQRSSGRILLTSEGKKKKNVKKKYHKIEMMG